MLKNLLENFLAKGGRFLVWLSCLENWETRAVREGVKEAGDLAVRAAMAALILQPINWPWVRTQKGAPKSHITTHQISRETGIHYSSVYRIVRQNLKLKCLKKRRAQELTVANCVAPISRMKTAAAFTSGYRPFDWPVTRKVTSYQVHDVVYIVSDKLRGRWAWKCGSGKRTSIKCGSR